MKRILIGLAIIAALVGFGAGAIGAQPFDPAMPVRGGTPGTGLASVALQPAAVPESVIPPDGRVYIGAGNNTAAPWRWVAYLTIMGQPGSVCESGCQCTGFLIYPGTVATAGHCVYDSDLGGWAATIRVAPGKDGAEEPFGVQVAPTDSLWSVAGWVVGGDAAYDYGAIILDHTFTGMSGFLDFDDLAAVGQTARLSGYPGEHPGQQWRDDDVETDVGPHIVSYEIDSSAGQSGSPVWYPAADSNPDVVAVHTRGVGDPTCYPDDNCGVRVESSVIGNFNYWRSLGPGPDATPTPGPSVGGIAELAVPESGVLAEEHNTSSSTRYAALAGVLAGLLAMGAGTAYAIRRRRLRL